MLKVIAILAGLAVGFAAHNVNACSIFAATGDIVEGGGSLISKTEDLNFDYVHTLFKGTSSGYPYYILTCKDSNGQGYDRFGINKYGLAIAGAGASQVKNAGGEIKGKYDRDKILRTCKNVPEALAAFPECFTKPGHLMIADSKEIACIEVGLNGKMSIKRSLNGYLAHTNHYLDTSIVNGINLTLSKKSTSVQRLNRINELLSTTQKPLKLSDFIDFINDPNVTQNGKAPGSEETVARMAIDIRSSDDFRVYFQYKPNAHHEGDDVVVELTKKDIFGK